MTTTAVADSKKAQLHAACALCGTNIRKVKDVAILQGLAKLQDRGRNLSHRTIRSADDPHLVDFRKVLNSVTGMSLEDISWRNKRIVETTLAKADALNSHFPQ